MGLKKINQITIEIWNNTQKGKPNDIRYKCKTLDVNQNKKIFDSTKYNLYKSNLEFYIEYYNFSMTGLIFKDKYKYDL
jgi:hypothetical protein